MDPDVLAALKKNEEMKNLLANKSGRTGASPLSKPQSQTHPSGNTESSLDVSHMSVHSPGKTLMAADVESDTVIQLKGTIENLIKDLGRALLEKQRCEAEIDSLRKKENMLKTALQLRTNSESAAVADAEHARNELQVVLEVCLSLQLLLLPPPPSSSLLLPFPHCASRIFSPVCHLSVSSSLPLHSRRCSLGATHFLLPWCRTDTRWTRHSRRRWRSSKLSVTPPSTCPRSNKSLTSHAHI
jgi:hypothetical protein